MNDPYRPWRTARTLTDLGRLTAQWLEGGISHIPGYGDGDRPAEETGPLVAALAAACRAGYVTTNSQPGRPLDDGAGQRAWVTGFCTEDTADKVKAAVLGTDLITLAVPPGWDNPVRIPVTIDDHAEFTWAGALDPETIEHYYAGICPHALEALDAAWQVDVIDPAWGRTELLWDRLAAALGTA